jgi:ribulose-5-phosphate 4-epimerase/fuculose-1-phosphate aldolase
MEDTERNLRIELAACYRIFALLGWDELIYNHITLRLPNTDGHFLINPYGLHYSEVTASNLIKVDINANVLEETPYRPNPAGMVIHSAIHAARDDALCIAHTHTDAGSAIACSEAGLRHDNFYSVLLFEQLAYHDFEGITVNPEEKARLVDNIGQKNHLILRNHGLLTCGKNIPTMFANMWLLQRACEIQYACDCTGRTNMPISKDIAMQSAELLAMQMKGNEIGVLEFNMLKRRLDKIDGGYRE